METLERVKKVSKIVKIIAVDKSRLPKDIVGMSSKKIGSVWTSGGDIYRPLSMEEEKIYLPYLLGLSATEPTFPKLAKAFWTDFTVVIDPDLTSLELEIGGGVKEDGTFDPINVMDWLRYRFAKGHPRVAATEEEILNKDNTKYGFYIEDKETSKNKDIKALAIKEDADRNYLMLFRNSNEESFDMDKVDYVIENYKLLKDVEGIEVTIDSEDKIGGKKLFLYNRKEANAERFNKILSDKLIKEKAMINSYLSKGVIQYMGNSLVDDQDIIGSNLEEAALFLSDPKNSKKVLSLSERAKALK